MCDALGRSVVSGRENASTRSPTDGTSSSDGFLPSSQSTPIDATNAMRASMDEPDDTQTSTRAVCPGAAFGRELRLDCAPRGCYDRVRINRESRRDLPAQHFRYFCFDSPRT